MRTVKLSTMATLTAFGILSLQFSLASVPGETKLTKWEPIIHRYLAETVDGHARH